MNITKKQFVISSQKLNIEMMDCSKIPCGYLYTDALLKCVTQKNLKGEECILLGYAFSADEAGNTPAQDIERWDGEHIEDLTYEWTGKWALIYEDEIVSDAAGLMPLFYFEDGSDWIISSSLAIMSSLIDKEPLMELKPNGLSWQLLPDTILDGVKKTFPFQKIAIVDGGLKVKENIWARDYSDLTSKEKCEAISSLLITSIKNIDTYSGRKIYLALTAGSDSRETLSAILASGIKGYSTYTFEHPDMLVADKNIPKKISKDLGFSHRYISAKDEDKTKRKEYIDFCLGNSRGADEMFYARGQFNKLPEDAIIIRSGLYEIGTLNYKTNSDIADYCKKRYSEIDTDSRQSKAFERWLAYIQESKIPFINDHIRFYLEQRVSGWVSAIEQSLDINDFVSVQIANNAHILSLLLSATAEEREQKILSSGVTKQNAARLIEYPTNKFCFKDYLRLAKKKFTKG